ncbi:MAG: endonuclease VIII [Chroococcidiopsidaceae cyanobacterium CP_BM_ER_R8_30]|nr:endonuclease VIII [Chroococcidiopsidaceae cyanobacterium CP_BM_ER_R8_30]
MPEGPEIRQAADAIAKAVVDRPVTELFFAFEHLKPYESKLTGTVVTDVQTKGKAILLHFNNQLCIYSHNQLYGKWLVRKAYSYPKTNRQLRLAIHNKQNSALLYSASDIEVISEAQIATHRFLSQLGPDVLDRSVTVEQVSERFQEQRFRRRLFTSLLLNQHFLCGLGNYLRSEVLFVARVHPERRPVDCHPDQITRLAAAVLSVTYQSYITGGITNDIELAKQLRQQGYNRSEYRHYVFNRQGRPCFICSTAIVKAVSGGRRYYYCPVCQI